MTQHVFISYAHKDEKFAQELKQQIVNAGFDHWIDRDQLKGSQNWVEEIQKAIDEAYALIVIKSPDSYKSQYVTSEWAYALGADVPIIPILYKLQETPHEWLEVNVIHHLDFTKSEKPPWDDLFQLLDEKRSEFGIRVRIPKDAPPKIRAGLKELNSDFPSDVIKAAERLGNLKNPIAVPGLVIILGHEENDVRNAALEALIKIGETGVSQLLEEFFRPHENEDKQLLIAIALGEIKSDTALSGLIHALRDNRNRLRYMAVHGLRRMKRLEALSELIGALRDRDRNVRIESISALIDIGDERAIPAFLEVLQDSDRELRSMAAGGIGVIREGKGLDNTAVQALINALNDPELSVQRAAINALGRAKVEEAIEVLSRTLRHENVSLSEAAKAALKQIGTADAVGAIQLWGIEKLPRN